jgi:predicted small lipoprotein YifL
MQRTGLRFMMLMLWCVLLGSAALYGCGKRGPLYLPDEANKPKQDGSQTLPPAVPKSEK